MLELLLRAREALNAESQRRTAEWEAAKVTLDLAEAHERKTHTTHVEALQALNRLEEFITTLEEEGQP